MGNKIVYKGYNVGETTQVSIMPTPTADNSGAIVQYVGATNANYINGYFYKCVSDGGVTPAYSWEEVDFGDSTPHWSGTRAEYEAIKDTLEAGTYVSITDDYDDGLEVVDVIEDGNMNPVTSNAVADAMAITTGTGTRNATYAKSDSFTATWTKIGHIVTAEVQFNLSQATLSTEEIITGFPKPVCPVAVVAQGEGNDKAYGLVLKTNGAIRTHYQGVADQFYHATITYITTE